MDKKILILLPIWKREAITKICFDNLKELQKEFNIEVLCIVSEQWSKVLAFEYGFKQIYASNECLGTKMNIGVEEALRYDFDYLMNLGSDDIITKDLFESYEEYFNNDRAIFGGTKVTFIDSQTKEAKETDYQVLIGAGRCIRKDVVKECNPLYGAIQKGLDLNSLTKMKRYAHTEIDIPYGCIYDIKSDTNIWSFDDLGGDKKDFETAVKGLSTKQIDAILEL